ncbi:hypothetical protein H6G41_29660 [Tolypothrix sp. FACHB-123]|uniref:hypothetical protein n=1 Tax=Tolypothrix sp. FACHB-123 TaxID=2692868 RepID=UPI00168875BD|nr:hypothetical protein [Tolypothrix sp. FACHB-123]MBD2358714.1 hypothetical protein [Tolypothrix sp. FACHB-123]
MSTQDEQIQRLRYFDNQFLKAEDFTTEQEYHLEMRRRHNRGLHTKGVAEGLRIIKTNEKQITVTSGFAIDENGNEIILLKDLPISLADTEKYRKDSTIYVFAEYKEKKEKPQPETSTDEKQSTRFFENAAINVETTEPDIGKKQIVRIGRLKFDTNGNVPDQKVDVPDKDQFLNKDFREEAAAKLPTFSISIQQLKTESKAKATVDVEYGSDKLRVPVFESPVSSPSLATPNIGAFILVYAFSPTENANFSWRQEYTTERRRISNGEEKLMQTQYVVFSNNTRPDSNKPGLKITITYEIYAVLPN